jgi:hypothetical protein
MLIFGLSKGCGTVNLPGLMDISSLEKIHPLAYAGGIGKVSNHRENHCIFPVFFVEVWLQSNFYQCLLNSKI